MNIKTCDIWEDKCDNKEEYLNCAHPFPRVSGYEIGSDIMEVEVSSTNKNNP